VVVPTLLVPLVAFVITSSQPARYQAKSTVYVKQQDLGALATGNSIVTNTDPARTLQTQITLATTPDIAARVLKSAGVSNLSPGALLGATAITADSNADILTFSVTDSSAARAQLLATTYALQYTQLRRLLDTQPLIQARALILRQIANLPRKSAYAATLTNSANQLQTQEALEGSNAVLAQAATGATQTAPQTKKYTAFGLGLGFILGIGLAFMWEALDTRVRSADEVAQRLGLPLLARVPEPRRDMARAFQLSTVEAPSSSAAESFRVLRTNLAFANVDQGARMIMISSALEDEGKSTTVANLAVVEARAGVRVALIDLDFRHPSIHKFFHLEDHPGITNVLLGQANLEQATAHIPIGRDDEGGETPHGEDVAQLPPMHGLLDVIPCGPIPPNPGEIVATAALGQILGTLAERYDLVLVDTPPILRIGDTLTLAASVPAMILMTRLPKERRGVLTELARVLDSCPARVLGFVLSGSEGFASSGYGTNYANYYYRSTDQGRRSLRQRAK
jgi:Mrp family chromosome partitioning ATPase/capsular polysaccharide biosynthesis protein